MKRLLKTLKGAFGVKANANATLNRMEYKKIWNNVSATEEGAKIAVSGYVDEDKYVEAANHTKGMLQHHIGIRPDDVVLEIGAGVGRVGSVLAPICKEWIGADVSENMLKHARRRLSKWPNVRTIALNGFDLANIPSASVDVVYSTVVYMHLDEWERFSYVKEGFRVLKPGGRMLVDNVDLTSDDGWAFFISVCNTPPSQRPPQVSKTSTPQELETYFKRAGFINIRQDRGTIWLVTFGTKPG